MRNSLIHSLRLLVSGVALAGGIFLGSGGSTAQEVMRIAAVVNDDVVSIYDLVTRLDIIIASSNLKDSGELRRQIAPQVLRTLIDERLEIQEAGRLDIGISPDELQRAISAVEQNNRLPAGGLEKFIEARRLDRLAFLEQIRTELLWSKVIRLRLGSTISVSDDEIDETLARLKENQGKPEYRVAEIFLAVPSAEQEKEIQSTAANLTAQLRGGATFAAIAQQFSQSATSAVGGDIGWLVEGQLPDELNNVVAGMKAGDVSDPIRTYDGFYILFLRDRRNVLSADPLDSNLVLAQLILPAEGKGSAAETDLLAALRSGLTGCEAMLERGKDVASPLSGNLGSMKLGDLPADLRKSLATLAVGQASVALPFEQGSRVLMICEREEASVQLPDRDGIRRKLGNSRLELLGRRYLRDLRRSAFIDFRI